MKLTAQDLHIGDWIKCDFGIVQVRGILNNTLRTSKEGITEIEWVEPIPITPEILEKNGFEKIEAKYYRYFLEEKDYYESVRVYFDEEPNVQVRVLDGSEFKGRIKYVHQFQQAMRLCGIKGKEIKL